MAEIKDLITQEELDSAIKETVSKLKTYIDSLISYDFATDDWEKISRVAESGEAEKHYNIGDEREINWNGNPVRIRIVDFNHYDKTDGSGKAGIVCEMVNAFSTLYTIENSTSTTGGWYGSYLRNTTLSTIISGFDSDFLSVVKTVNTKSDNGYGDTSTINQCQDTFFLPALSNIYSAEGLALGSSPISNYYDVYSQIDTQWEYYKNEIGDASPSVDNDKLYKTQGDSGSTCYCWLRDSDLGYYAPTTLLGACWSLLLGLVHWNYVYGRSLAYTLGVSLAFCI